VAHGRASRNPTALAWACFAEGKAAAEENPEAALTALDEARAVAAEVGCRLVSALALAVTVVLRGRHGPTEKALALYYEVIGLWRATANETLLVALLSNLGLVLARIERYAEAVDLTSTLQHAVPPTIYGVYGAEAERVDAALAKARAMLGAKRYTAAWSAGALRSVDEAAERAQQLLTEHATTTRPVVRTSLPYAPRSQGRA
jgi:tetratricopeptide (TPR) repeat protein